MRWSEQGDRRWPTALGAALLAVVLAGCTAPVPAPSGPSYAHPECIGVQWNLLAQADGAAATQPRAVTPARPGWPLGMEGPVASANLTHVAWRPDGGDPAAPGTSGFSFRDGRYVTPVVYRLQWSWHESAVPGITGPALTARYAVDVEDALVAQDAEAFLAAVGHPDAAQRSQAFVASGTAAYGGPRSRDGPDPAPDLKDFALAWDGPPPRLPPEPSWNGTLLRTGAWAFHASVPEHHYGQVVGNLTLRFTVDAVGRLDAIALGPADADRPLDALQAYVRASGYNLTQIGPFASHEAFWCDPRDGTLYELG